MARFTPLPMERLVQRFVHRWQGLIHPREDVPADERQRARAVAALVAVLFVVFALMMPIWIVVDSYSDVAPLLTSAFILLVLIAAFFVSRRRHYRIAVWMLIGMLVTALTVVFFVRLSAAHDADDLLKFLSLGVILASLTLDRRSTVAIAVIVTVFTLIMSRFAAGDTIDETFGEVVFQIVIAVLTIAAAVLRDNYAAQLRASERRYRALFEQSRDPIFVIKLDGSHFTANRRVSEVLGYPVEYLLKRRASDFIAPRERGTAEGMRERLLAGETLAAYERHLVAADGTEIPFEMTIGLVRDEEGKPEYIQSVARDLRPRKQAEQEMLRANLERERAKILARFVQGVSHEFRTPLAVIGTSAYMLSKSNTSENVEKRRKAIEAQVARIDRLLVMMMTMVKLDAEDAIERLPVYQRLLNDAFRQVLANAIQYTPPGGRVHVRTCVEDDMVRIDVQDTGAGIPEAIQERIFERFFRGDEAHSTEGFGLGLSIAQAIVQRHGGRLTVESTPGAGSTFHIYLPIHAN
ncbi:MAG: PAS domain S-box protein [Chloroflexi bacterium]|nr:PAS domain S-box protein [Chloroflexota bacterium]